jgi:hypothetical protein
MMKATIAGPPKATGRVAPTLRERMELADAFLDVDELRMQRRSGRNWNPYLEEKLWRRMFDLTDLLRRIDPKLPTRSVFDLLRDEDRSPDPRFAAGPSLENNGSEEGKDNDT